MGVASRFIIPYLLHHPRHLFCLLLPRHYRLPSSPYLASLSTSDHLFTLSTTCRSQVRFPVNAIHTRTSTNQENRDFSGISPNSLASHPWPEWSRLIDFLSSRGYFYGKGREILFDDEFVAYEDFSYEFVRASSACLAFARDQSVVWGFLSRRDIAVVVENGTAFLFKSAIDSARRMRAFLGNVAGDELDSNKAYQVDLMKYLLSYVSNTTVSLERSNLQKGELIESAVRNLLSEFPRLGCVVPALESSASVKHQIPNMYGQISRPLGQNMEMKRGDWICPRCTFMNFARNVKCLRCEDANLSGSSTKQSENGSTNLSGSSTKQSANGSGGTGKSLEGSAVQEPDPLDMSEEAKAQRWFRRVAQIKDISELSEIPDEDFPSIMPMRKGVNRFVVSKRKTPLERRLTSPQYRKNLPVVSSDPLKKKNENS